MTSMGGVVDDRHAALDAAIACIVDSLRGGGTLFCCGNGGSDAHAGHLAAELVGRFEHKTRGPLRAVHLSTGGPVGSCLANDYGFDAVFARQVEALARAGDVVLGISTSGRSGNVLAALHQAWMRGARPIAFVGADGLSDLGVASRSLVVRAGTARTFAVQEHHQVWVHDVARRVEEALCPR